MGPFFTVKSITMLKDLISALKFPSPDDWNMKHAATNASILSSVQ